MTTTHSNWQRDFTTDPPHREVVPNPALASDCVIVNGVCTLIADPGSTLSTEGPGFIVVACPDGSLHIHDTCPDQCVIGQVLRLGSDGNWQCSSLSDLATTADIHRLVTGDIFIITLLFILIAFSFIDYSMQLKRLRK